MLCHPPQPYKQPPVPKISHCLGGLYKKVQEELERVLSEEQFGGRQKLMHAMKKKGFTHEIYWTWTGRKKREKHI
jgi:hypothetical protein